MDQRASMEHAVCGISGNGSWEHVISVGDAASPSPLKLKLEASPSALARRTNEAWCAVPTSANPKKEARAAQPEGVRRNRALLAVVLNSSLPCRNRAAAAAVAQVVVAAAD
eukprot:scaffold306066_cov24-Tisochrysis_lutea.AAC.2